MGAEQELDSHSFLFESLKSAIQFDSYMYIVALKFVSLCENPNKNDIIMKFLTLKSLLLIFD